MTQVFHPRALWPPAVSPLSSLSARYDVLLLAEFLAEQPGHIGKVPGSVGNEHCLICRLVDGRGRCEPFSKINRLAWCSDHPVPPLRRPSGVVEFRAVRRDVLEGGQVPSLVVEREYQAAISRHPCAVGLDTRFRYGCSAVAGARRSQISYRLGHNGNSLFPLLVLARLASSYRLSRLCAHSASARVMSAHIADEVLFPVAERSVVTVR